MTNLTKRLGVTAWLIGVLALGSWGSAVADERLDPHQAGARHGQALGVVLVCYGMRTTSALEKLAAAYTGTDQEVFKAESDKVLLSWQEAKNCKKSGGPNECRLIHDWSCRDALREIGPQGTKLPGLVEAVN